MIVHLIFYKFWFTYFEVSEIIKLLFQDAHELFRDQYTRIGAVNLSLSINQRSFKKIEDAWGKQLFQQCDKNYEFNYNVSYLQR